MSALLYPVNLIKRLQVLRTDRTIVDDFESGGQSARQLWTPKYFKRKFSLTHSPLTIAEFRYLRSFFGARSGRYDPFYFRDNIHRGGNAYVRLASALPEERDGSLAYQNIQVELEEVAPKRILPEVFDFGASLESSAIIAWYDADKVLYYLHAGSTYQEATIHDNNLTDNLPLTPYGATVNPWSGEASDYAFWTFENTYAKTSSNVTLSGAKPAFTIFAIVSINIHGTNPHVLSACGTNGTNGALGLASNGRDILPWIGGNTPGGGWTPVTLPDGNLHSIFCVWNGNSDAPTLYLDGAATAAGSSTRSYSAGVLSVGAKADGSDMYGLNTDSLKVAQLIYVNGALSTSRRQAVHNTFAYKYGLAEI